MTEDHAAGRWFGAKVKRIEDPALLRGRGRFVDDIHLPNMLHASFVRSPHAHALVRGIGKTEAMDLAGVVTVLTLADLAPYLTADRIPAHQPSGAVKQIVDPYILAKDEVCHVGEAVAVVIATHPYLAEDAAGLVDVDYEVLPAISDCRDALKPGAALARRDSPDNIVGHFVMDYGDADTAFAGATHVFRETLFQHKGLGHAIECRGVVARHEPRDDLLTVWSATQMAHRARNLLVTLLGLAEDQVRVITPDVGGGFGPKFVFYPEEVVIPVAAKTLGRPVKWVEDRREHFIAATQERDQLWDMEAAVDGDGRLLAVRGTMIHDHGAATPYGVNLPYNAGTNFLGPYELPAFHFDVTLALTNKVPVTPVRGAGRPQGTFAMERIMDRIARELGLDRAEVRRRNMIGPERMPYTTEIKTRDGAAMTYDSGDYPACLEDALDAAGYADFGARQAAARADGRYLGIGVANYVEGTGRGPFESATVRVGASGRVMVYTGATTQGQGNKTTLAQICAQQLGVAMDDITVVTGDTGTIPVGLGAFASRQAVTAGSSVHIAASDVRDKAIRIASHVLEAAEEDLVIEAGRVHVKGVPDVGMKLSDVGMKLSDVAREVAGMPGFSLPGGVDPGLEATANFSPPTLTYCNGTHVAEVAADPETGLIEILNYVIVHDSGRLINPMIVGGQVVGGAVHGLGCALFERMIFDDDAQPQSMNFGEYLMPTAPETPSFALIHKESPTPLNPLGVKGAGEGGTIPVTSVIASAVEDALSPFGVKIDELPILPQRIVELVRAGGG